MDRATVTLRDGRAAVYDSVAGWSGDDKELVALLSEKFPEEGASELFVGYVPNQAILPAYQAAVYLGGEVEDQSDTLPFDEIQLEDDEGDVDPAVFRDDGDAPPPVPLGSDYAKYVINDIGPNDKRYTLPETMEVNKPYPIGSPVFNDRRNETSLFFVVRRRWFYKSRKTKETVTVDWPELFYATADGLNKPDIDDKRWVEGVRRNGRWINEPTHRGFLLNLPDEGRNVYARIQTRMAPYIQHPTTGEILVPQDVLHGVFKETIPCDARCYYAKGHDCECTCGGANHGAGLGISSHSISGGTKAMTERGGPGSGHFGHRGRPGQEGGSLPGAGVSAGLQTAGVTYGSKRLPAGYKDMEPKQRVDALNALFGGVMDVRHLAEWVLPKGGETELDVRRRVGTMIEREAFRQAMALGDDIRLVRKDEFHRIGLPSDEEIVKRAIEYGYSPEDAEVIRSEVSLFWMSRTKAMSYAIMRQVTLGNMTPADADAMRIYEATDHKWVDCPDTLYHVTTNLSGVSANGIMSRYELGLTDGKGGLGGGSDITISFTDNLETAKGIERALVEAGMVARGDIGLDTMLQWAAEGRGADKPWLRYAVVGTDSTSSSAKASIKIVEQWERHPEQGMPEAFKELGWYKGMADDPEQVWDFYRLRYVGLRESAGGPMDPVLMNSDLRAFAGQDPAQLAIVQFEPLPNAKAMTLGAGLDEYRMVSNDAIEQTGILRFSTPEQIVEPPVVEKARRFEYAVDMGGAVSYPPEHLVSLFGKQMFDDEAIVIEEQPAPDEEIVKKAIAGQDVVLGMLRRVVPATSILSSRGGPGSGHFGHAGRPGKVGGSLPGAGISMMGGDGRLRLDYSLFPKLTTRAGQRAFAKKVQALFDSSEEFRTFVKAAWVYSTGGYKYLIAAASSMMQGNPGEWLKEERKRRLADKRAILDVSEKGMFERHTHVLLQDEYGKAEEGGKWVSLKNGDEIERGARLLLDAVANSPDTDTPIYRGIQLRANAANDMLRHKTIEGILAATLEEFDYDVRMGNRMKMRIPRDQYEAKVRERLYGGEVWPTGNSEDARWERESIMRNRLYRETTKLMTVGGRISLPLISFTHSEGVAKTFARGKGGGGQGIGRDEAEAIIKVTGKHNGLNMAVLSGWPGQQETVVAGTFVVKSVKMDYDVRSDKSYVVIEVEQETTYAPE